MPELSDRERAENLWEELGGDLCICQGPEVPHWCEKCQMRISLIESAIGRAPKWEPIRTAPKDIEVLLFCPERGPTNHARVELGLFGDTRGGWEHSWATFWIPLPEAPST